MQCKNCKYYTPRIVKRFHGEVDWQARNGDCSKIIKDPSDYEIGAYWSQDKSTRKVEHRIDYGSEVKHIYAAETQTSDVYVGENFGCIHFENK